MVFDRIRALLNGAVWWLVGGPPLDGFLRIVRAKMLSLQVLHQMLRGVARRVAAHRHLRVGLQVFDEGDTRLANSVPVCRFYGNPARGLDSHFYSASPDECAAVQQRFPDDWLLFVQHSPSAQGGRGLGIAKVFDRSGVHVATIGQEGMVRVPDDERPAPDDGQWRRPALR